MFFRLLNACYNRVLLNLKAQTEFLLNCRPPTHQRLRSFLSGVKQVFPDSQEIVPHLPGRLLLVFRNFRPWVVILRFRSLTLRQSLLFWLAQLLQLLLVNKHFLVFL